MPTKMFTIKKILYSIKRVVVDVEKVKTSNTITGNMR